MFAISPNHGKVEYLWERKRVLSPDWATHRGTPIDIYAFGCLLIEIFGEKRVWKGLNGLQIMQRVCGTFRCAPTPPLVAHVPLFIKSVCTACCELEPAKWPSITDVAKMLNSIS